MAIFTGLDVSDKTTHLCVVDGEGAIAWRGVCATDPDVIAKTLERHGRGVARVMGRSGDTIPNHVAMGAHSNPLEVGWTASFAGWEDEAAARATLLRLSEDASSFFELSAEITSEERPKNDLEGTKIGATSDKCARGTDTSTAQSCWR